MASATPDAAALKETPQRSGFFPFDAAFVIETVIEAVLVLALLGEVAVVFLSVLTRELFNWPWVWTDEIAKLSLSTMAFVGGAFAYRRGEHSFIRNAIDALPPRYRQACSTLVELLVFTGALVAGGTALTLFAARWGRLTDVLQVSEGWFVLPVIAGMLALAITSVERLLGHDWRALLAVGAPYATLVMLLLMTYEAWSPWLAEKAAPVALALFAIVIVAGLPVGFALILGAVCYLYTAGAAPMVMLAQTMLGRVGNFVLLALPFFIFAGFIMERGALSLPLVRLVQALVGHFRGGLYHVMVASMYLVSGLSGSEGADVAAVGLVLREPLRRQGYNMDRATAALAAGAAMGVTVPPSVAMMVLVSATTLSAGTLFIAGFIPAAVVAACIMMLVYFQCRRLEMPPVPRASLTEIGRATRAALLPLGMVVILFGGIFLGMGTPTEVSSFAVVYGLLLAVPVYHSLNFKAFLKSVIDCAAVSGMILFIVASASSFAWMLNNAHLPQNLIGLLRATEQSQTLFMLASIVLLLVTGMILEGLPSILVLAPILMPIAGQLGVNQIHYGIVLLIAMNTGAFLPPVGIGFYICCAILETKVEKASREMVAYFFMLLLGLVLVALVPWFTLFLPELFHMTG